MNEEMSHLVERLNIAEKDDQKAVFEEAIEELESTELALLLESLPLQDRLQRWEQVPQEDRVDVLVAMRSEPRATIIESLEETELQDLLSGLHAEDLIELAESLPEYVVDNALSGMDADQRKHYQLSSQYDEDQIGRYVDHELIILPRSARVRDALRRIQNELPDYTDCIYLIQRNGSYVGTVPLHKIYLAPPQATLISLSIKDPVTLSAESYLSDATEKMEHSGLSALPVIDSNNLLLGRLTLRLALEITREEYESQLMATAGLNEDEDLFAPVFRSSKRRATWLGINLLTAFLASWTIGLYESTLQEVVALAVLMPIVASMGGIAGSQTLTLIIRGIALGQIAKGNMMPLLIKEVRVGAVNGVLWALVIGIIASLWFSSFGIGLVIATAIVINIIAAAFSGVIIPIVLDKFEIDPALSGSVILTTVTDVVGFVAFLALGSAFLMN
ncbi:magnesium transporter [Methylicorpusculum sp.]|uniref:magnesium transporter n=1 Tax=Methylicorpusculum sp. TaxID=2713644 RepID=UPI00272FB4B2|nr:magnesium transporter [Methylicorpusculum sp.]MDP2177371.1 magnesium transporter [Methylicorpusculum sp.]MDP3530982.1 magnesium transporter [Methylicorpusculum sp.]MDZ4149637.1 magnesium transporter [Methylicorpusculum sp.]